VLVTKGSKLMMLGEMRCIYCENYMKHLNTPCDKMQSNLMLKPEVRIFITAIEIVKVT